MPGFEFFGTEERKEVNDVLETGILMRYGFDGPRKGIWKAKEMEAAVCETFGCKYAQLVSSGTAALTAAMSALGIGYGDEIILPASSIKVKITDGAPLYVNSFAPILSSGPPFFPIFPNVISLFIFNLTEKPSSFPSPYL